MRQPPATMIADLPTITADRASILVTEDFITTISVIMVITTTNVLVYA